MPPPARHTPGPALYLPRPAGSILSPPDLVIAGAPSASGLLLPPGLLAEDGPVRPSVTETRRPEDMVLCAPSPQELGLPTPALEEVIDLVSGLPFTPAMRTLNILAAEVHHHPDDREHHLRLAVGLYPPRVLEAVTAFVCAGPTRLGFDPRHIATTQRLVLEHAAGPERPEGLTTLDLHCLGGAILGVAGALPHGEVPDDVPDTPEEWAQWARFTTLIGAWHGEPEAAEAIARAHSWYRDVHGSPELASHKARCDIDAWLSASAGLTLEEQLAGGMACAAVTGALDADRRPQQRRLHIEPGFLRDGPLAGKEEALVKLISATREEYLALFNETGRDSCRIAWDHSAFEQRPLLRDADGTLRLTSPRALLAWMTHGIHHRALRAARDQPHPRKRGKDMANTMLTYAGALGEESLRRLVVTSHAEQVRAGVVTVGPEHEYHVGKRRLDSPDLALGYAEDIVLLEVYSGRISREARTTLDPELLRSALDNATTKKLVELSKRTDDLLGGDLTYDGFPVASSCRIWPVVVLAGDGILQTPALWRYLEHAAPEAFRARPGVQRPVIADLDDLEPLLSLVQEEGHLLPQLLGELLRSPFAQLPPRNWVHATFGGVKARPRYTTEQANAAIRLAGTTLFPTSKRLAEFDLAAGADPSARQDVGAR